MLVFNRYQCQSDSRPNKMMRDFFKGKVFVRSVWACGCFYPFSLLHFATIVFFFSKKIYIYIIY